ncbi:malto-oligosyltrehalose trehalohydrolase [Conexibacter sp. DBS9H8]|uniref:malto-oligosyltrehalose trehalohydrolase n=1 Tax=Conexibacter sp. DBS9H8 TaxID=2937801 RepID=UPI002010C5E0|nr:malto-oligosyltrehalose trehalohydrolase [Conexibacter sp. DBS9H8]
MVTEAGGHRAAPSPLPWLERLGAHPVSAEETAFRVWAPAARDGVAVILGNGRRVRAEAMAPAGYGVYTLTTTAPAGTDYRFQVNGRRLPDPASASQPTGLRGPSRVWAPPAPGPAQTGRFSPAPLAEQVIYELHIGTFSEAGTFTGAIPYLAGLAELGVTAIEVMPIGEFPGARGWGYDGVYLSAAQSTYGGPDGFLALVEAAHACGLAVILDVVYNHVGASGVKALEAFGPYFTDRYETPWGRALNYDDAGADPVREWVCQSAERWVGDFGVDGLRLDAVHAIFDASCEHLVAELSRRVKAIDVRTVVIAESALNDPKVMRPPDRGGWGTDASWADDFHHAVRTLLTDEHEGYYADFGAVGDLAKALGRPFVYDGVYSPVRDRVIGAPAGDLPRHAFVVCTQNHDQVGNRAFGDRLAAPARPLAAMLTLLSGYVPMLFMGEEYGEDAPFQFFCDHIDPKIAEATRQGRRAEFAAFASFGSEIPDPMAPDTFAASTLTRREDPQLAALYRALLSLRGELDLGDPTGLEWDEDARQLTVTRPGWTLVANFGPETVTHLATGRRLALGSDPAVSVARGTLTLPAWGGAVLVDETAAR